MRLSDVLLLRIRTIHHSFVVLIPDDVPLAKSVKIFKR